MSDKSKQANLTVTGINDVQKKVQMERALICPSRAICMCVVCSQGIRFELQIISDYRPQALRSMPYIMIIMQ